MAYRLVNFKALFESKEEVEKNMIFLGFSVFENLIKSESAPVMKKLKCAEIDCKIVTGDNILTAFYVGDACGLFDRPIKFIEEDQGIIRIRTFKDPGQVRL